MITIRSDSSPKQKVIAYFMVISVFLPVFFAGCGIFGARPPVDSADVALHEIRDPDIHFVPTPQDVVDKMLELAKVTENDLIYDLGCGDGRIVVTAAERYGCRGVGYDIDPERVIDSMKNVEKNNVEHLVRIEQRDVFTLDLSGASVVTLYLLPSLNVKLIPQLKKLKPGARIVSHDFDMHGVKPDRVITIEDDDLYGNHTIYLWTAPLNIDGGN
jgi:SAM-dependent methyltransferase